MQVHAINIILISAAYSVKLNVQTTVCFVRSFNVYIYLYTRIVIMDGSIGLVGGGRRLAAA